MTLDIIRFTVGYKVHWTILNIDLRAEGCAKAHRRAFTLQTFMHCRLQRTKHSPSDKMNAVAKKISIFVTVGNKYIADIA